MKNLKTLSFSILINADRKAIWDILWNPVSYPKWTTVFCEGNYYKGELKEGNTIQFLNDGGDGMTSYIQKCVENEQIAFIHQAELKNGIQVDFEWHNAKEIYYLKQEADDCTELQVIVDVTSDMEKYFTDTFPKALRLIKKLSEQ